MKVFIVYCHPSKNSFTYEVKEAFVKGLESAGHSYEISDLYADGFNPVMSEKEYIREGFYNLDTPSLWILENNVNAERLYRRMGFTKTGRINAITDELAEIEMALEQTDSSLSG